MVEHLLHMREVLGSVPDSPVIKGHVAIITFSDDNIPRFLKQMQSYSIFAHTSVK